MSNPNLKEMLEIILTKEVGLLYERAAICGPLGLSIEEVKKLEIYASIIDKMKATGEKAPGADELAKVNPLDLLAAIRGAKSDVKHDG